MKTAWLAYSLVLVSGIASAQADTKADPPDCTFSSVGDLGTAPTVNPLAPAALAANDVGAGSAAAAPAAVPAGGAAAPTHPASQTKKAPTLPSALGSVTIGDGGARLVVRVANPPRTRLVLSIDDPNGTHYELIWDPATNDGLQHSIVLPAGTWSFTPSVEDERIQTGQVIMSLTTTFVGATTTSAQAKRANRAAVADGFLLQGNTDAIVATPATTKLPSPTSMPNSSSLVLSCEAARVEMSDLHVDSRKVSAAVTARSLLDQSVPEPIKEALSLIAEIAIERAKSGAMELVKAKFVDPMCTKLTLGALHLDGTAQAFPRTCGLLAQLRLEDVLSSGKSLIDAAKDDVRRTIAPKLLEKAPISDELREMVQLALDFGNRMLDGESSSVVEADLLIALLDHVSSTAGFEESATAVTNWLTSQSVDLQKLRDEFLNAMLPDDFGGIADPPWADIPACLRKYTIEKETVGTNGLPDGYYFSPSRDQCLAQLKAKVGTNWLVEGAKHKYFQISDVVAFVRNRLTDSLGDWLKKSEAKTDELLAELPDSAMPLLESACAARIVVGVTKWCSTRESCSAGDIADALAKPANIFARSTKFPEKLCWKDDGTFRLPGSPKTQKFIELTARLTSFLTPVPKGEESKRAIAMVRWMFDLVRSVEKDNAVVDSVEDIIDYLLERDYLRAITSAFALAKTVYCKGGQKDCKLPAATVKAGELVGAVASYVQTYEETKTLDASSARQARKKALESLIDSATDRRDRGGAKIYSLGIPVGFAFGGRFAPGDDLHYPSVHSAYDADVLMQLRLPLAIARQRLPAENGCVGTHLAFWVADLGQFTRSKPSGASDALSWKDFVGFGAQAGVLLGTSSHAVVLALEGSWSPGLYAKDVNIDNMSGDGTHVHHLSGAFTLGATLAYYVPLFDFN